MGKNYFKLIPAAYLFLRKGDSVLLLLRANTGYQDGNYSVIAGHLDGNELATLSIIREAKEEAGIDIKQSDLRFVHVAHRLNDGKDSERVDFFFETDKWHGEIRNMEPDKCHGLEWFSINSLPKNMLPFISIVLKKVSNGEAYSEYTKEP